MSSDTGRENKCRLCGRTMSEPTRRACRHAECGAGICQVCFEIRGRHYCLDHRSEESPQRVEPRQAPQPTRDPGPLSPAVAPSGAAAVTGGVWAPVSGAMSPEAAEFLRTARVTELNFISRFQENVESRDDLPLPSGDKEFRVRGWPEFREITEDTSRLKRIMPAFWSLKDLHAVCPVGAQCRYTFRRQGLVVEARSCVDFGAAVSQSPSAPPLAPGYLLELIEGLAAHAEKIACEVVGGLFSVTGWEGSCVAHLVGDDSHPALVHPTVSVCLIGPEIGSVQANPTDRRMGLYLPLFRGETVAEEAARYKPMLIEELYLKDRVFVNQHAREHGISPKAARLALKDATAEREDIELVEVKDLGPALKWRK